MTLIRRTLYAIIIIRSALDIVFESLRLDEGGMSPGAALNGLIIMLGLVVLLRKGLSIPRTPLLFWIAYLGYSLLSLLRSPDFYEGLRLFLGQFSAAMIFFIAANVITTRKHAEELIKCVIYSSLAVSFFAIIQYVFIDKLGGRLQSTFEHPNILAFYLVLVVLALFYLPQIDPQRKNPRWKMIRLTYVPFLLILLVLTETRSAWIAIMASFILYSTLINRKMLLCLILVPPLLLVPAISNRLTDLGTSGSAQDVQSGVQLDSYSWRQLLWEYALIDSSEARTEGKGLGSFRSNSQRFFPLEDTADAHSAYIQTLYETGVIGLGLYIAMFGASLVTIWKTRMNRKSAVIAIVLIVSYLLESYSDNTLYYLSYNWYFWTFIGCHLAMSVREKRAGRALPQPTGPAMDGSFSVEHQTVG
ncbi:O-antigen ligase family protein [Paraburkholderia elongata]|uniref:O-antigen ligase-related domain-containing protein n=1 Tax=Paraburkholderia elongata TaxID=2675747 RepID=A0A972NRW9_9BURK|nr:O-antigen ligase family protein [Paraburkholderia elongata]NPT57877.1 hypothetical protein [Paraburkholderia elongata]